MEPSCFLMEDLSWWKEFSSSASPSPHQDGWPYRGVPRGIAPMSPETDANMQTQLNKAQQSISHFTVALTVACHDCHVLYTLWYCSLCHGATKWTQLLFVYGFVISSGRDLHHWPIFRSLANKMGRHTYMLSLSCSPSLSLFLSHTHTCFEWKRDFPFVTVWVQVDMGQASLWQIWTAQ